MNAQLIPLHQLDGLMGLGYTSVTGLQQAAEPGTNEPPRAAEQKGSLIIPIGGIGGLIAMALSYHRNEAVGWALLHGILGWTYVAYYAIDTYLDRKKL